MGTWGTGNCENDAALDFVNMEVDRHVSAIEDIFSNEERFRLDEDAEGERRRTKANEGELVPRVEILLLLCERCGGVLQEKVDIAPWKARYLEMYDDQVDGLEPTNGQKQRPKAAATSGNLRYVR